ncbi:MAG TPA: hypothetical protein VGL81_00950 [Polyangiaceae bacterium]
MAGLLGAAALAGCDTGHQDDQPVGVGAPVHIVGANVGPTQALVTGAPIEIAFDRLLNPFAVNRQTFVLQDLFGNFLEPTPSYDPVARVVRLCMQSSPALLPDQSYQLTIIAPTSPTDPAGFRAIDGAGLDPSVSPVIEFPVVAGAAYTGSDACAGATAVDFCSQVLPIFASKCGTAVCHGTGPLPAAGLLMTTPEGIQATAVGRVAQGSNTGNAASAEPPGLLFGVDMPIISPGSPGNSWLVYKLLLAEPPACSSTPGTACDAGAPGVEDNRYPLVTPAWALLSDSERATLSNYIQGREMPYPVDPSAPLDSTTAPLTGDELDTVSTWILQGAGIPAAGCAM